MNVLNLDPRTTCAHAGALGEELHSDTLPFILPVVQTSLFDLGSSENAETVFSGERHGYTYTRFGNPTVDCLAKVIAQLEGGQGALIAASGNAATLCALTAALRGKDDLVVSQPDVFGGTMEMLRVFSGRYHVPVELVEPADTDGWGKAVARASVVFIETPSNPLLGLVDLAQTAALARAAGAKLIVDNTVATPYNQRPFRFGADLIVHSASKYLNGHSDMICGCLISREPLETQYRTVHRILGGTVNALDAWLVLRGLRTFALRMEAHNRNGAAVATWLSQHPSVRQVYYPGLPDHPQAELFQKQMTGAGGVLSFELHGGEPEARLFIDRLKLIVHALSFGGTESLAVRPAATSHRALPAEVRNAAGVTDSLLRLSVGTEAIEDILGDLDQALM